MNCKHCNQTLLFFGFYNRIYEINDESTKDIIIYFCPNCRIGWKFKIDRDNDLIYLFDNLQIDEK